MLANILFFSPKAKPKTPEYEKESSYSVLSTSVIPSDMYEVDGIPPSFSSVSVLTEDAPSEVAGDCGSQKNMPRATSGGVQMIQAPSHKSTKQYGSQWKKPKKSKTQKFITSNESKPLTSNPMKKIAVVAAICCVCFLLRTALLGFMKVRFDDGQPWWILVPYFAVAEIVPLILLLLVFNSSATFTSAEAMQTMTKGGPHYNNRNGDGAHDDGPLSPEYHETATAPNTWQPFYQLPPS